MRRHLDEPVRDLGEARTGNGVGAGQSPPAERTVRVRATPGARREAVVDDGGDGFSIAVREKAEQGRANARIRELLAERLGVPVSRVRLISGAHRPSKRFLVLPGPPAS